MQRLEPKQLNAPFNLHLPYDCISFELFLMVRFWTGLSVAYVHICCRWPCCE